MDEKKQETPRSKKIIKAIVWTIVSLLALLIVSVSALLIFIDPILKGAIVNIAPAVAKVNIELEDISVSIFKGRVEIKNLIVRNPEGYASDYAIKLGDVALQTDILSWLGDGKKIIREVRLRDIDVNYETEFPLSTDSNLNDILNNIKAIAEQQKAAAEPAETAAPESEEPPPMRFQIDKVIVDNIRLAVVPKGHPNFSVPLIITLPELGPVGTDPEGMTGAEITAELFGQVLEGIVKSVSDSSKEIYKNLSTQGLKLADDLVKGTKDVIDNLKKEGDNAAEALKKTGDSVKKIGDDAKNLWDSLRGKK